MAETSVQVEVAEWICAEFLPEHFGKSFSRQRVSLSSGGDHSFAAVSTHGTHVGTVCTGSARRASGGLAVGKLNKVRADLYFLLLAKCEHRFIAVTQPIMFELLRAEQEQYGRIPADIEIVRVDLPSRLRHELELSQQEASREVTPV